MKYKLFIIVVFVICSLLTGFSLAQNKVVVIPLTREASPVPYAPLTAASPPVSAYFDNLMGGHVTDKVTGLVWQKSDDDIKKNWHEAWDYCQNLELPPGGWTDWRLPSIDELMSIVDYGARNPSINSVFFGTQTSFYWSATTKASSSGSAWAIYFISGYVGDYNKSTDYFVRCVRGLSSVRDNNLKINGDGTVSDHTTGLMWQRETDNAIRPWDQANSYCQGLSLGGKQDWRLPNVKELHSITDSRVVDPTINVAVFLNPKFLYWSATSVATNNGAAWSVWFDKAYAIYDTSLVTDVYNKSYYSSVRCVR